jgi:hypothetical protein
VEPPSLRQSFGVEWRACCWRLASLVADTTITTMAHKILFPSAMTHTSFFLLRVANFEIGRKAKGTRIMTVYRQHNTHHTPSSSYSVPGTLRRPNKGPDFLPKSSCRQSAPAWILSRQETQLPRFCGHSMSRKEQDRSSILGERNTGMGESR